MTIPALPELLFSAIPAAARGRYLGDRFSFMQAGSADAPGLLLLHGIGANSMHWRFQYTAFADRLRVVGWNTPGYMLTDALRDPAPDGAAYADAIADFMDSVGLERADVLANSFGTRIAQFLALRYPNRVRRLVFTGTGAGRIGMTEEQRQAAMAAREAQVASGGYGFGERVAALLGPDASATTVELVRGVLRATNPAGFLQAVRCTLRPESALDFADRVSMKTLLIQGDHDQVNPLATNALPLSRALPDCRLEILERIGHLPEVEAPERVNTLVRGFLLDS